MGYFQDSKDGYSGSPYRERQEMEEAGFDPDCIEDRILWRNCKACGQCQVCKGATNDSSS